jgi:hypothetical protein
VSAVSDKYWNRNCLIGQWVELQTPQHITRKNLVSTHTTFSTQLPPVSQSPPPSSYQLTTSTRPAWGSFASWGKNSISCWKTSLRALCVSGVTASPGAVDVAEEGVGRPRRGAMSSRSTSPSAEAWSATSATSVWRNRSACTAGSVVHASRNLLARRKVNGVIMWNLKQASVLLTPDLKCATSYNLFARQSINNQDSSTGCKATEGTAARD